MGLSQEELAIRIGVSRQSISKWEIGEASPEISKLPLLAKEFGVSVDWLLSEDEIKEENTNNNHFHQSYTTHNNVVFPSWIEKLPKSILHMVKRFGWIYGLIMAGEGLLVCAFGLFARMMFKTMILGDTSNVIQSIGNIPDQYITSILMNPNNGFYSSFECSHGRSLVCLQDSLSD